MPPLLPIAISLVPDLAQRLARKGGKGAVTQQIIIDIVREILGTEDPDAAAERIKDARLASELRIRLAEIDARAREAELRAERHAREAELEALRLEIQQFRAGVESGEDARGMLETLAGRGSPFAWGSVVVSAVVTVGFFATLLYLMQGGFDQRAFDPTNPSSQLVFQIVNIAVGALTAGFATVVSFWLGSSDGSRRKDLTTLQVHTSTAAQQRDQARAARDLIVEQTQQTRELIAEVTQPGRPAGFFRQKRRNNEKPVRQFHECVDLILKHEGGYVDHPDDPGGATNLGITHKTLAAWRGAPVTRADVRALSVEEAREIYRANYWNALNCDQLPAGVDLAVFDFGVNAGVSRAAKMLQRIVGAAPDGQIGPISIAAVSRSDAQYVIETYSAQRLAYYRGLRHWPTFGKGWSRRTSETRSAALAMRPAIENLRPAKHMAPHETDAALTA